MSTKFLWVNFLEKATWKTEKGRDRQPSIWIAERWEVNPTDSESCPVADFVASGVESSGLIVFMKCNLKFQPKV